MIKCVNNSQIKELTTQCTDDSHFCFAFMFCVHKERQ